MSYDKQAFEYHLGELSEPGNIYNQWIYIGKFTPNRPPDKTLHDNIKKYDLSINHLDYQTVCPCTHDITTNAYIMNIYNNNVTIVGICCKDNIGEKSGIQSNRCVGCGKLTQCNEYELCYGCGDDIFEQLDESVNSILTDNKLFSIAYAFGTTQSRVDHYLRNVAAKLYNPKNIVHRIIDDPASEYYECSVWLTYAIHQNYNEADLIKLSKQNEKSLSRQFYRNIYNNCYFCRNEFSMYIGYAFTDNICCKRCYANPRNRLEVTGMRVLQTGKHQGKTFSHAVRDRSYIAFLSNLQNMKDEYLQLLRYYDEINKNG